MVSESGALPVWIDCLVVTANVYQTLFSTERLQVDMVEIDGDTTAAQNLEADYDGTGYDKANSNIGELDTIYSLWAAT